VDVKEIGYMIESRAGMDQDMMWACRFLLHDGMPQEAKNVVHEALLQDLLDC
jgi:hypothetical protein